MAECCKETICTHCVHLAVCVYKEDYLALAKTLQPLRINKRVGNDIVSIPVSNLAFCGEIIAPCRFYKENLPVPRSADDSARIPSSPPF